MHDLFRQGAVVADLAAPSKKALFNALGSMAERAHGIDAGLVIDKLTERERLGSTGFGGGVAIPHGKIEHLPHVVGVFARLSPALEYDAVDALPVDLVYMLLSPADSGAGHLKALASVSRKLRDRACVAKLRKASSTDAIVALLAGEDDRHRDAA